MVGGVRRWRSRRSVAVVAALAAMLPMVSTSPTAADAQPASHRAGRVQTTPSAPHHSIAPARHNDVVAAMNVLSADHTWPASGAATLAVSAATGSGNHVAMGGPVTLQRIGRTPLEVGLAAKAPGRPRITGRVYGQAQSAALHLPGVVFSIARDETSDAPLDVALDYSSFRNAIGGGWADDLRLVELPGCALTTPSKAACRAQTPVAFRNDSVHYDLSATVTPTPQSTTKPRSRSRALQPASLPATAGSMMVLAATAGTSGPTGNYQPTSLSPSGSWSSSGASGDFNWSYPVTLPPVAAGADVAPQLNLAYDSGMVDGQNADTNNQPSSIGEGWDHTPGYIERTYRPCSDDWSLPNASQLGDWCWAGQQVTFSLGARSGAIVQIGATNNFKLQGDDGSTVQLVERAGGYQNEYWVITTTAGVQYYFGLDTVPGGPTTNSAWTVPVYGANSGDRCYNAQGFASSSCSEVWRWNLDYVVDPNGNATDYQYTAETGYYAPYYSTNGTPGNTTPVAYDRDGYLTEIDYGLRVDVNDLVINSNIAATGKVTFSTAERCIPQPGGFQCDPADFTTANANYWPDTPQWLDCSDPATGGPASACGINAPSFWSHKRTTAITTAVWAGSSYQTVDTYTLDQYFPVPCSPTDPNCTANTGTAEGTPELQLKGITRTAYSDAGQTPITLPKVGFAYQLLDNRINGVNDQPAMDNYRLTQIETETGEYVEVYYSCGPTQTMTPTNCSAQAPQNGQGAAPALCTPETLPAQPVKDTSECYPVYWTPPGNITPILDWFHKYVVTAVQQHDGNGTAPDRATTYTYLGNAGWHYNDNEVVDPSLRTYSEWRGYRTVQVRTGDTGHLSQNGTDDTATLATSTYFQGMDGDTLSHIDFVGSNQPTTLTDTAATAADLSAAVYGNGIPAGTTVTNVDTATATVTVSQAVALPASENVAFIQTATRHAQLTDSKTNTYTDSNQWADFPLETQTFDTSSSAELNATINAPIIVATTATQNETGLPPLTANIVETAATKTYTDLANNTTLHEIDNTYDPAGRLTASSDTGTGLPPLCTTTSYGAPTGGSTITNRPAETISYSAACPADQGAAVLSDVRRYYDNEPLGTVAATGNLTESDTATATTNGVTNWAKTTYVPDSSGRTTATTSYVSATDTTGRTTQTQYVPSDGGPLTETVVTNPLGQTTTTVTDAARGVATESVNLAGQPTTAAYDALGRITQVWKPGMPQASYPTTPSESFNYQYEQDKPLAVTTNTYVDPGNGVSPAYDTSINIYDAFGALRQTQTTASGSTSANPSIVVTDTLDDSHGWTVQTNNRWFTTGTPPTTTLTSTTQSNINDSTQTRYDSDGRPVNTAEYTGTRPTWHTQTVYSGNATTVIPDICDQGSPTVACDTPPGGSQTDGIETTTTVDPRGNTLETQQWITPPTITNGVISGGTANSTTDSYTPLNQPASQTTAAGTSTAATSTWTYDLAGRAITHTDPDAGTTQNTYNNLGELTATTDANTNTVAYSYDDLGRKLAQYANPPAGPLPACTPASAPPSCTASWLYDTLQAGQLTSDTTYLNGNPQLTIAATGYDSAGNQLGSTTTVPSTVPGLSGSYTTSDTYSPTNQIETQTPASTPALPNETIDDYYNTQGEPTAATSPGVGAYVTATTYSPYGQPDQYTLGVNNQQAQLTNSYDPQTLNLDATTLSDNSAPPQVENTTNTYNPAGNITRSVDTQGGTIGAPVETNCYTYNTHDQLTQAWSSATTNNCNANPSQTGTGAVGGPQPYDESWTFDPAGDRSSQTQLNAAETAQTQTTYTNGGAGPAHGLASTTSTTSPLTAPPGVPGSYQALTPDRILDTRYDTGGIQGPVAANSAISLTVEGAGGVPASGVSAVAVNVTAIGGSQIGALTVYPDGVSRPTSSNLNWNPGQVVANLVIVPVGADGKIDLYNSSNATAQFIADVQGYYLGGGTPSVPGAYQALTPDRILDTRYGTGGIQGPVAANSAISLTVEGAGGVPASGVSAVAVNVTAIGGSQIGALTVYPDGVTKPTSSNLNWNPGQVVANLVIVPVGADGKIDLYNSSNATAQFIADVQGYYLGNTATPSNSSTSYGYDADGNTKTRNLITGTQTLTYNPQNQLTSISSTAGNVTYTYDADGNVALRQDPTGTTLYLPGEEITENSTNTGQTATRYYSIGSTVIAERTGTYSSTAGQSYTNPTYLYSNITGTTTVALPTGNCQQTPCYGTPIRRFTDPYGNTLAPTTGGTWPDNHAFLNKPTDTTTNLDQLGARQYDPTTGAFTTVDPEVNATGQPYSYAGNNPVTNSDPTGFMPEDPGTGSSCPQNKCGNGTNHNNSNYGNGSTDNPNTPGAASPPTGTQGTYGGNGGWGGQRTDNNTPPPTPRSGGILHDIAAFGLGFAYETYGAANDLTGGALGPDLGNSYCSATSIGGGNAPAACDAGAATGGVISGLAIIRGAVSDALGGDNPPNEIPAWGTYGSETTGDSVPQIDKSFQFGGAGRSGAGVKNFVGPQSAVVRGASQGRIFVTDDQGRVILDITRDRVKPVVPGQGFVAGGGRKLVPTEQQLDWIDQLWGGSP